MNVEGSTNRIAARPLEPTLRQALLSKEETLAIEDEGAHGGPAAVQKQEERSGEGVFLQLHSAEGGQGIDSFTSVDGLECDQDLHVGRDLQHQADLANSRKIIASSKGEAPARSAFIKPWGPSTSIKQLIASVSEPI